MFGVKTRIKKFQPDWLIAVRRHRKMHGEWPNLIRPQTFNEKILHRLIFDRRILLRQLADKFAVRAYVKSRLGSGILPELYHVTSAPPSLPFDRPLISSSSSRRMVRAGFSSSGIKKRS